jgi:two-component system response regulator FixJ
MTDMSGPELQAELVRRGSRLPIIFVTAHGDIPTTVHAMKAGAVDFLTKPIDGAQLMNVIEASLRLNRQSLDQRQALSKCRARLATLTRREREIMALALAGECNKAISKKLGISHRTVEIHRSHLLRKTATANLLELAQLVADCNLVADANGVREVDSVADDVPVSRDVGAAGDRIV